MEHRIGVGRAAHREPVAADAPGGVAEGEVVAGDVPTADLTAPARPDALLAVERGCVVDEDVVVRRRRVATTDDDARYALYQQAESYLLNDVVAVAPINFYVGDQVYQEKVSGYDQPPLGIIQWEDVSVSS